MTPKERAEPLKTLAKIQRIVRRTLREGLYVDPENLSMNIWLESWKKEDSGISAQIIRGRCVDVIRTTVKRKISSLVEDVEDGPYEDVDLRAEEINEAKGLVGKLIAQTSLGREDRQLLFDRFYSGLTVEALAGKHKKSETVITRWIGRIIEDLRMTYERTL